MSMQAADGDNNVIVLNEIRSIKLTIIKKSPLFFLMKNYEVVVVHSYARQPTIEALLTNQDVFLFIPNFSFREETNATTIIPNNINAPVATSSNNFTDMMTMKADSSFTLVSQVYVCVLSC